MTERRVIGCDPGGRYTAVVVVNDTGAVLEASTLKRDTDEPDAAWLTRVVGFIAECRARHPYAPLLLEGVEAPKGFSGGKRAPINPGSLIGVSAVFGAVLVTNPSAIVVPPRGHGSRPIEEYPAELTGRATGEYAPPAGTRRHERSAFDIAVKGI